jgi:hypothetical protein
MDVGGGYAAPAAYDRQPRAQGQQGRAPDAGCHAEGRRAAGVASGHEMVWDAFDHTVTIFMPKDGPNPEGAIQIVYKGGTPEELGKMPNLGVESAFGLSKVRAQILEFLRANQARTSRRPTRPPGSERRSGRRCATRSSGLSRGACSPRPSAG